MFGNRALTLTVVKKDKPSNDETIIPDRTFERNAYTAMRAIESVGAKMFLGVCVYILLDTHRQVSVAKVMYNNQ